MAKLSDEHWPRMRKKTVGEKTEEKFISWNRKLIFLYKIKKICDLTNSTIFCKQAGSGNSIPYYETFFKIG